MLGGKYGDDDKDKWAICDFQRVGWQSRKGDNRWSEGTARGLKRDHAMITGRFDGSKNFVNEKE